MTLEQVLFTLLDRLRLPDLAVRMGADRPTVVLYHGVHSGGSNGGIFNYRRKFIAPEALERQLRWFRAHCRIVSPAEFRETMKRQRPFPPRSVLVTFDDGYANLYHHALPILRALNVPAVIFVVTDLVDRHQPLWFDRLEYAIGHAAIPSLTLTMGGQSMTFPLAGHQERVRVDRFLRSHLKSQSPAVRRQLLDDIVAATGCDLVPIFATSPYAGLTWEHIGRMQDAGLTFAPHTMSHPSLAAVSTDVARREILGSRDVLQHRTGATPRLFAYPYGQPEDFTPQTQRILRDTGFDVAFTTSPGRVPPGSDLLAIPRISLDGTNDFSVFRITATGLRAGLWRIRDTFRPAHAPAGTFFHRTASTYLTKYEKDDAEGHSFRERKRLALAMLGNTAGLSVLDVGSGPGVLMDELTAAGADVTAVDIAPGMIELLSARYPGLRAHVGDIERLAFPPASFDRVLALGVLEYLDTDALAFAEIARVLKLGGEAIISFPNVHSPWRIWRKGIIAPARFFSKAWRRLRGRERYSAKSRHYSQEAIRLAAAHARLEVVEVVGYNMRLLPTPLHSFFPRATVRLAAALRGRGRGQLKWLGTSYIVRLIKPRDVVSEVVGSR